MLRVYIGFHILYKYLSIWPYIDTLFSNDSFARYAPESIIYGFIPSRLFLEHDILFFWAYLSLVSLMILGVGKRGVVFGVFMFTVFSQKLNGYWLDGGDNLLKLSLFYLSWADSFQCLALVRSKIIRISLVNCCSKLAVASLMLQLALTYSSSGLTKVHTSTWYSGYGLYYSMINERFATSYLSFKLVQFPLVAIAGNYFVMFWELTFGILVWFRRTRYVVLLLGVFLHLGIFLFMGIRSFALLFIASYIIFLDDETLRGMQNSLMRLIDYLCSFYPTIVCNQNPLKKAQ